LARANRPTPDRHFTSQDFSPALSLFGAGLKIRADRTEGSLRPRFSIARLMALILVIAVGLAAALAGAFAFAVVTLSATTIGALLSRGPSRAFFLGCTVFGSASILLAFGEGAANRNSLPTSPLNLRVYETIHGPVLPPTFTSPDEAGRWVVELVQTVNGIVTFGYALISLALALVGGFVFWLIANRWKNRAQRSETRSPVGGPLP
jgi:hypothetical protein